MNNTKKCGVFQGMEFMVNSEGCKKDVENW